MKDILKKFKLYRRKTTNVIMLSLSFISAIITIIPLFLVFYYTISKGISYLNFNFFTKLPTPVGTPGGGMANAIVGTLILIGIGGAIGIPIGIFTGTYLSELELLLILWLLSR